MILSESDFNQIIAVITKCSGIIPKENHKDKIRDFIEKRLEQIKDSEPVVKFKFLLEQDKNELAELVNAAIYNESYFFKEEKHFAILEKKIFPEWLENNRNAMMQIWSAGCAAGEEAYSLAILAQACQIIPTITASDINASALKICSTGNYSCDSKRYDDGAIFHNLLMPFLTENKTFSMSGEIRSLVHTKQINFAELKNYDLLKQQHVIFLRNVLTHFSKELSVEVLKTIIENCLADGGYLFLSQKEAVSLSKETLPNSLKKRLFGETIYFCKQ